MAFIPMILILAVAALGFPSALPFLMAYFLIGGCLGAAFAWAARNHRDKTLARWAAPMVVYNLYGWPVAIVGMFVFTKKGAPK